MSDNGTFDRITGKAKEAIGKITGSKETEIGGKLQQTKGKIKEVVEDAEDAIKGVANHLKGDKQASSEHTSSAQSPERD